VTSEPPPPRPPRPIVVHIAVDILVAFLAIVILGLILGFPLLAIAITSIVVGAIAAPFTRRAQLRAFAAREQPSE
jgi:type III secretory pathway component EscV